MTESWNFRQRVQAARNWADMKILTHGGPRRAPAVPHAGLRRRGVSHYFWQFHERSAMQNNRPTGARRGGR